MIAVLLGYAQYVKKRSDLAWRVRGTTLPEDIIFEQHRRWSSQS